MHYSAARPIIGTLPRKCNALAIPKHVYKQLAMFINSWQFPKTCLFTAGPAAFNHPDHWNAQPRSVILGHYCSYLTHLETFHIRLLQCTVVQYGWVSLVSIKAFIGFFSWLGSSRILTQRVTWDIWSEWCFFLQLVQLHKNFFLQFV